MQQCAMMESRLPCHSLSSLSSSLALTRCLQIATTADDATLKVWHIQRQQPEERAGGAAEERAAQQQQQQPWVYPWQQRRAGAGTSAAFAAGGIGDGEVGMDGR